MIALETVKYIGNRFLNIPIPTWRKLYRKTRTYADLSGISLVHFVGNKYENEKLLLLLKH